MEWERGSLGGACNLQLQHERNIAEDGRWRSRKTPHRWTLRADGGNLNFHESDDDLYQLQRHSLLLLLRRQPTFYALRGF